MKTYHGSCHCGAVQFNVTADITNVIRCNCSYCSRKGMLLAFIPKSQFVLLSGEAALTEYRFNTKHIAHTFCAVCGVQCFGSAAGPDGETTFAINVNTLEDFPLADVVVQDVDGKSR
jgi:hypothetical protein